MTTTNQSVTAAQKPSSLFDSANSYAQAVDGWISSTGRGYFKPLTNLCMLTEEVGEVARIIARCDGEQRCKAGETEQVLEAELADELADVIFIATCIANERGIDLGQALAKNLNKKYRRDIYRYTDQASSNAEVQDEQ